MNFILIFFYVIFGLVMRIIGHKLIEFESILVSIEEN